MKYCVYVLLLEEKRLYVGITPTWRIQKRYEEHMDPEFPTTRWTTRFPTLKKICVFNVGSKKRALQEEHRLTEELMKHYGLDSTRGGNFVMLQQGGIWWTPPHLMNVPRFTHHWEGNSTNFRIAVQDNPIFSHFKRLHY